MEHKNLKQITPDNLNDTTRVDKAKRKWISERRCACCGAWPPCDPAHQRVLGNGGMGMKPPDTDLLPICHKCHDKEHRKGIYTLWHENSDIDFQSDEEIRDHINILTQAYEKFWLKTKG